MVKTVARKLSTLIALSVIAVVMSIGSLAIPAQAAGCSGHSCSGKDANTMGCANDAITTQSKNTSIGSLQVRWSPSCKTNWTRLVIYPTGNACVFPGSLKAVQQNTNYTQKSSTRLVCGTYSSTSFWTPMIYSPVLKVKGTFQSDEAFTPVVETGWS